LCAMPLANDLSRRRHSMLAYRVTSESVVSQCRDYTATEALWCIQLLRPNGERAPHGCSWSWVRSAASGSPSRIAAHPRPARTPGQVFRRQRHSGARNPRREDRICTNQHDPAGSATPARGSRTHAGAPDDQAPHVGSACASLCRARAPVDHEPTTRCLRPQP
jgi:hypothetical protein